MTSCKVGPCQVGTLYAIAHLNLGPFISISKEPTLAGVKTIYHIPGAQKGQQHDHILIPQEEKAEFMLRCP